MLGLPNGDIVTGSTGRKDEHDRHVDFKIRFWRKTSAGAFTHGSRGSGVLPDAPLPCSPAGGPAGYSIFKVITDHDQAVRAFALLSGGAGFVSVANDGTAKVRRLDGSVLQTFINPVSAEGKPYFCFGVAPLALPGCFATCNEDLSVRVYSPDGLTADILHPGATDSGCTAGWHACVVATNTLRLPPRPVPPAQASRGQPRASQEETS